VLPIIHSSGVLFCAVKDRPYYSISRASGSPSVKIPHFYELFIRLLRNHRRNGRFVQNGAVAHDMLSAINVVQATHTEDWHEPMSVTFFFPSFFESFLGVASGRELAFFLKFC
jgi:hypothetical protein